jgi:hypothetical protein
MTGVSAELPEQPVLIGTNGVFAIVAEPEGDRRRFGVILLNSGLLHRVGPSRLYVQLSRRLAALGFVTARIDVSGKGDTPRRREVTAEQSLLQDYDDVSSSLESRFGLQRFILIGLCSGADDAYAVASSRENVAGLVLLDGYAARTVRFYFRHYGSRVFHLELWISRSRRIIERLLRTVGRTGDDELDLSMAEVRDFPSRGEARSKFEFISQHCDRCLCVYTSASHSYYNYAGQLRDGFPTFRPRGGVREIYIPAAKHTYPLAHHRRIAIESVCEWAMDFS